MKSETEFKLQREQSVFYPQEKLSASEWAEKYRVIVSKDAAEPGRWRNARAPYLREIMDALSDPTVEEVYHQKAARIGGSEVGRNALSYWIDRDPGPVLIVFPTETKAKEQLQNELIPLLSSPPLDLYMTDRAKDMTRSEIELAHMRVYPGWAGSPITLAERTIRYVWLSEVDKYPLFSGREADPLSLAKRRTQTFGYRRKIYVESTPTTRLGVIARACEAAPDKRYYWVPCPKCGDMQKLVWAQVRWEKKEGLSRRDLASKIEAENGAWYECSSCSYCIREHDKPSMLDAGEWRCEGTVGAIRAYYTSGLMSMLGTNWSRLAARHLRASASREEGDFGPLMEFVTQDLGEPYEEQVQTIQTKMFIKKRETEKDNKKKLVPRWAGCLIATADTQKDYFWWLIRAWGVFEYDGRRVTRSRLLDWGKANSFTDLKEKVFAKIPVENTKEEMSARCLLIDTGGGNASNESGTDSSRTDEVYKFTKTDPARLVPIKGHGGNFRQAVPIKISRVEYKPKNANSNAYWVTLHLLDTVYYADCLAALMSHEGEPRRWETSDAANDEYISHMTGEVKVLVRKGSSAYEVWQKRSTGRRVDLLDCERYQLAGADMLKLEQTCPLESQLMESREKVAHRRPTQQDGEVVSQREEGSWWTGARR